MMIAYNVIGIIAFMAGLATIRYMQVSPTVAFVIGWSLGILAIGVTRFWETWV